MKLTIGQALTHAVNKIKCTGIKNPHLEAEILLSDVLRKPREYILAHGEKQLSANQIMGYELRVIRRAEGEPLPYITGHKEFYGLDFRVNRHVLIPRPETEMIIEEALKYIKQNIKHATVVDAGTGSGCIIISLVKQLQIIQHSISNIQFLATDICKPALATARKNAERHGVNKKIKFYHGNLLEPIIRHAKFKIQNSKLIILANLPYLTPTQIKDSPSIKSEPKLALAAGPDGLKYYRKFFGQIKNLWLSLSPSWLSVFAEIDPSQTAKIKRMIKTILPEAQLQIKKDLREHNRLAVIILRD